LSIEIELESAALRSPAPPSEPAAAAEPEVKRSLLTAATAGRFRFRTAHESEQQRGRERFAKLVHAAGAPERDGAVMLTYPLPYRFQAQSPGRQRQAAHDSWNEIEPHVHPRFGPAIELTIGLERLTMHRTYARFSPAEMRSIRFGHHAAYLPWWIENRAPEPKLNCVMHYLVFREFGDVARRGDPPEEAISGAAAKPAAGRTVFEPGFVSRLLDVETDDDGNGTERITLGYFAAPHDDPNLVALYKFQNFEIAAVEGAAGAIHRAIRENDEAVLRHARVLRGREVIEELAQIPVEPRIYL
jgi:hypothetical protein